MEDTALEASTQTVQQKIRRLHSLLFGVDLAFARGDTETGLGLALRLLGFLESECLTAEDIIYVEPIRKLVYQKLAAAKQGTQVDSQALEQAKCPEDFKFRKCRPIELEKIKTSKFYRPCINDGSNKTTQAYTIEVPSSSLPSTTLTRADGADQKIGCESKEEASIGKSFQTLTQSKLTSLYSNGNHKVAEPARVHVDNSNRLSKGQLSESIQLEPAHHGSTSQAPHPVTSVHQAPPMKFNESHSPEAEEKHNNYAFTRKRPRHPYGAQKGREKARPVATEVVSSDDDTPEPPVRHGFVTAKEKLVIDAQRKNGGPPSSYQGGGNSSGILRTGVAKTLGMSRRGVRGSFVPPMRGSNGGPSGGAAAMPRSQAATDSGLEDSTRRCLELLAGPDGELPDRLRNLEPRLLEHVSNEIMDRDPKVRWDDIAGLEHAKKCVTEMVIWPLLRPDIFQGCRAPGKGLLLFGPPGTGKTMIGKAIAGEAKATFFSISASSLTSKWIGEGEKLVRALFGVASCRQPAVIFIDEIDSLLSQRKADGEHESSRRLKTQFLIEMEGCGSCSEQILLIGATNRPQELDEAARRRLSKRLYIPLPSAGARAWIVRSLLKKDGLLSLTDKDVDSICASTDGYSGSDMKNLVKEASMGPLREALMQGKDISNISNDEMRSISLQDFISALQQVRPSVSQNELGLYEDWNLQFGSLAL